MGNKALSVLHIRQDPEELLRQLLDLECLHAMQFNQLYFALNFFSKINKDPGNSNSSMWPQVQGKVRYCLCCKKTVLKDIDSKSLLQVRKIVKQLMNKYGEGSSHTDLQTSEIVPIGDTVANNPSTSTKTYPEIDESVFANRTLNMKGFVMFFRTFILRFHLVIDEMAVKWALTEYFKLSKEEQSEYNRMKLCICHVRQRSTGNRSFALTESRKKQDLKSEAKTDAARHLSYKLMARSMFTLRNDVNPNQPKHRHASKARRKHASSQVPSQPRKKST